MLQIVFIHANQEIVSVVTNGPDMGTTYTQYNVIVCTKEDALLFFAAYPQEEIDKILNHL